MFVGKGGLYISSSYYSSKPTFFNSFYTGSPSSIISLEFVPLQAFSFLPSPHMLSDPFPSQAFYGSKTFDSWLKLMSPPNPLGLSFSSCMSVWKSLGSVGSRRIMFYFISLLPDPICLFYILMPKISSGIWSEKLLNSAIS